MFCPVCRSEYVEGFTSCADCLVELVAVLPGERWEVAGLDGAPIEIYRCPEPEADVIRSMLEANGIVAMFGEDYVASAYNLTPGPPADVGIVVGDLEADRARSLIARGLRGDLALDRPLARPDRPPGDEAESGDPPDAQDDEETGEGDG